MHLLLYSGVASAAALLLAMGVRRRNARSISELGGGVDAQDTADPWPGSVSSPPPESQTWGGTSDSESSPGSTHCSARPTFSCSLERPCCSPARSATQIKQPSAPTWAAPAVIAAITITTIIGFALSYASAFNRRRATARGPRLPRRHPEHYATQIPAQAGLGAYLVATALIVLPISLLLMRRRLSVNAITAFATGLAILAQTVQNFTRPSAVVAAVAGLVVQAPSRRSQPGRPGCRQLRWLPSRYRRYCGRRSSWPGSSARSAELATGTVMLSALISAALVSALEARKAWRKPLATAAGSTLLLRSPCSRALVIGRDGAEASAPDMWDRLTGVHRVSPQPSAAINSRHATSQRRHACAQTRQCSWAVWRSHSSAQLAHAAAHASRTARVTFAS